VHANTTAPPITAAPVEDSQGCLLSGVNYYFRSH